MCPPCLNTEFRHFDKPFMLSTTCANPMIIIVYASRENSQINDPLDHVVVRLNHNPFSVLKDLRIFLHHAFPRIIILYKVIEYGQKQKCWLVSLLYKFFFDKNTKKYSPVSLLKFQKNVSNSCKYQVWNILLWVIREICRHFVDILSIFLSQNETRSADRWEKFYARPRKALLFINIV